MAKRKSKRVHRWSESRVAQICLVLAFFLMICFSVDDCAKAVALVMLGLTAVVCFIRRSALCSRLGLPLLALILVVLMGGISTAYAVSGKFALKELLKLVIALCGAILFTLSGKDEVPWKKLAGILEGSAALIGLFSVDLVSTRLLSTPFLATLGWFSDYYQGLSGVESGVRITSFLNNPNIFAGCVGIGVLLALSLVLSAQDKKERRFHLCCLYISSTAFVLAFSMGAIASIAAAFVVYLILEHRERRGDLLVLMAETFVLVLLAVVPISMTALDGWVGIQPVPLLALAAGAALLCLADNFVGRRLSEKLRGRSRLFLVIAAAILALAASFALAAYHWTGDVTLAQGESLRRSAYLQPGGYTLSVQGDDGVYVTIETQNQQDTMMHTSSVLYEGELSRASFTVPEDSLVVYLNLHAAQSAHLEQVVCVGAGQSVSLPLEYKLLPDFIANRLQGLFANQNAIQRTVFFRDGMKLFRESPVIGLGLGSFENAIFRVQEFFYETKYVHNHYIQTLLETGVIGLILLVGLLGLSAAAILLSRRKESFHPLTPALGALLIFMAIHGGVEVVFSSNFYLPLAFGVFALINLCCANALPTSWLKKRLRGGISAALVTAMLVFGTLLCGNMMALSVAQRTPTYSTFVRAAKLDKFEWADYALSYVMTTVYNEADEATWVKAEEYAQRLDKVQSNQIHFYLSMYYFTRGEVETAMEMAMKHARFTASNSEQWNNLFDLLEQYEQNTPQYREGVACLADFMKQWDGEHMGSIELNERSQAFLARVLG